MARIYLALADLPVPVDVVVVRKEYVERYADLVGTILRPAFKEGRVICARSVKPNPRLAHNPD